jgi:hypothetical protein
VRPANRGKPAYTAANDGQALPPQELVLERFMPTVAACTASRGDDTMVGHARLSALAHDIPDRSSGARTARQPGDVAVGRDAAGRNTAGYREHSPRKRCRR